MSDLVIRAGSRSAQGLRSNNEDRLVVDPENGLFLVADGMGGQDCGELASGMAAEILPKSVRDRLAGNAPAEAAVRGAFAEANEAIVHAGRHQPLGRRMGTTAVLALRHRGTVYVAGLGDSRAYLIRDGAAEQLTVDHSVAQALVQSGALSPEDARHSPYQHVLHRFLGCSNPYEEAEIMPLVPRAGDRLLLASDGLTNHLEASDLLDGPRAHPDSQEWADQLVETALLRGSRDNVTCIVLAFEQP